MEIDRGDGRNANQLRPVACSRGVLNRAHGSASWSQGETKVLAAVYGPKAGSRKNENPERACIEVIWKAKTGQIGKPEKECEMILKRTLQSICLLNVHPNTTTSIIVQIPSLDTKPLSQIPFSGIVTAEYFAFCGGKVIQDDGGLLPCAVNAACAALVDAGIPLEHLAVGICCCLAESGRILLDPNKLEEQNMKGFVYLVFPNPTHSVLPDGSLKVGGELLQHGIVTSVTHGAMSVDDYLLCVGRGRAACEKLSVFLRRSLQTQTPSDISKAD